MRPGRVATRRWEELGWVGLGRFGRAPGPDLRTFRGVGTRFATNGAPGIANRTERSDATNGAGLTTYRNKKLTPDKTP